MGTQVMVIYGEVYGMYQSDPDPDYDPNLFDLYLEGASVDYMKQNGSYDVLIIDTKNITVKEWSEGIKELPRSITLDYQTY